MHVDHLQRAFAPSPERDLWCKLTDAEVNGRHAYEALYGSFPPDQQAFVKAWIVDPALALQPPGVP